MDFIEIMIFCGFDLDKSHNMAKEQKECPSWIDEALKEIGLEKIPTEPLP